MNSPHPAFKFDAAEYGGNVAVRKALVILIDFEQDEGSIPKGNFENLLFSRGTYSTGSMRDLYLENSYGLLDVQGVVVGWVRSEKLYSYYVDGNFGLNLWNEDRNARGMAEEALRLVDPLVDFSEFDNDGPDGIPSSGDDDGYVDALMVVHAGPGAEETGSPLHILSHQAYFTEDQVYDGVRLFLYTTEPENGRVGVFAHEFGHTLGLPDLYDLGTGPGSGVGKWSLMGTGVWLNGGRTPAHLDAWSKVRLGFVEPAIPESNVQGVRLPAAEAEPVVYKIWTNGRPGTQYFLAERRERRDFDAYLPGEGLLVYHVDESVRLQDDPNHYLVALEQADGQRDLELQSGNDGDSGDPFPGATNNRFFTPNTVPSSRSYDESDTQISLTDISDEDGETVFDLEVETEPSFVLEDVFAEESEGDGDGRVEAGERGIVKATVRNVGLGASIVEAFLEALHPAVTLDEQSLPVGEVRADSSFDADFAFSLDEGVLEDPIELAFEMEVTAPPLLGWDIPFAVGGGAVTGFADDFESEGLWSHASVTEGREDAWSVTTVRSFSGFKSWGFSEKGNYPNLSDGVLLSPPILIDEPSRLSFFYWMRAESLGSSLAWDGGRVEISHKGGPWRALEPVGGYPFTVLEFGDTPLARAGVFSGARDWTVVSVDLSEYTGLIRIRFRFVSDDSVVGQGWYIDDVVIDTAPPAKNYTAYLQSVSDVQDGAEVRVGVTLLDGSFNGAGFNVYSKADVGAVPVVRDSVPPGFTLLNETPLFPDSEGRVMYLDQGAERGRAYFYLVEDLGLPPDGPPSYLGPGRVYLCLGRAHPSILAAVPNPFVPQQGATARLILALPDPGCVEQLSQVEARVFDASGRSVRVIPSRLLSSGLQELLWDGTSDAGEAVPSGVYFWRVKVSGQVLGQKVVVIR